MRYTKTANGLTNAQDIPKIKNFACAEDVCDAVDNDDLQVGEVFSVPVVNGIFDDLSGELAEIKSYIPNSTSVDNQLTNVSQVQEMIESGGTSFDACWTRLCNVETCANNNHSNIVQIGAVIPSDATSSNQLVTNATMASCLNCKVDCSDYNTAISNLESCPGLQCVGTLVASDIADKASCTDLTSVSNRVTCLESCSGLDCIGTLVPSDLTSINNSITSLNTCATDLGTAVNNLCSCSGLDCTGTSTATFSLSGTTLTIIN